MKKKTIRNSIVWAGFLAATAASLAWPIVGLVIAVALAGAGMLVTCAFLHDWVQQADENIEAARREDNRRRARDL